MKKTTNGRGRGQPPKNKPQHKARYIRDLPDATYYNFMALCKIRGHTIGEALAKMMQKELEEEQERLELLVENIRGR